MRKSERQLDPPPGLLLEAGDALVLFGADADLERAEVALLQ